MIPIALSTGSLYTYGLARVFELAAQVGFDAIEIMVDQRWDSRHPAYLQQLSTSTGLPVMAVHSPFVPHVPGWPHDPLGRLKESVCMAQDLGAPVVVTHLPFRIRAARIEFLGFRHRPLLLPIFLPTDLEYERFLLNGLRSYEAEQDVYIGVENMPARRMLGRQVSVFALNKLEILATMPHLTLDTTHLGTWGLDPAQVYERMKSQVVHVHLSDFSGEEHQLPGDGHLPLGDLLRRLAQDGYTGGVSLEFNPDVLQAEDETEVLARLESALRFCRAQIQGAVHPV